MNRVRYNITSGVRKVVLSDSEPQKSYQKEMLKAKERQTLSDFASSYGNVKEIATFFANLCTHTFFITGVL